jgi:putative transposase
MNEREFPGRLRHETPRWIPAAAIFHIRIRADVGVNLVTPATGRALLDSAAFYTERGRWWAWLMVLMPDHLHALLSFPREERMSKVIADWKGYHAREREVRWQEGYFDHRLRQEESFAQKAAYLRSNPVVKGLCATAEEWPWVYAAERELPAR